MRSDPYVYAYLYGLCVHKLAHFFDVVHGTRHDFYMSEYRANPNPNLDPDPDPDPNPNRGTTST